jgi:hypothetical protein
MAEDTTQLLAIRARMSSLHLAILLSTFTTASSIAYGGSGKA